MDRSTRTQQTNNDSLGGNMILFILFGLGFGLGWLTADEFRGGCHD
jgi:hypothetical protein